MMQKSVHGHSGAAEEDVVVVVVVVVADSVVVSAGLCPHSVVQLASSLVTSGSTFKYPL